MDSPNREGLEWVDVHTHLNMLPQPVGEVLEAARASGVKNVITIGTQPEDWPRVMEFCTTHPEVKGTLGVHPQHAALYSDRVERELKTSLQSPGIVACGEIGLDYYRQPFDPALQREVFSRQMSLAGELNLPVEIHTRSAEGDSLQILKKFAGRVRGLVHCFTGTWEFARAALDLGHDISFSGIVTFKKALDLKEVCRKTPLSRLHLETDAPYLAPVPYRGKSNQPAYLIHTAEVVAGLKKVSLKELSRQTLLNRDRLFNKQEVL